jgi:TorA maturation chaperone TorD
MMNTRFTERELQILAQSDALNLLADVFRGPGGVGLSSDQAAELAETAGWRDRQNLADHWRALADALCTLDRGQWSVEHHRLFEGATVCPLNQTAYVRRDKGVILGDLCGFYEAFSLRPRAEAGEKPDHLVSQLEFLSLLMVMRAQAIRLGQQDQQQVVEDAARRFAEDHLADWLGLLTQHLRRTSPLPLFHALADVVESTWLALAQDHGWPALATGECLDADLEPPSDECGPISDPAPTLTVAGRPVATHPVHSKEA